MKKLASILMGTCAVLALASTAWAAPKTFVYCSEGSPSTFNPQIATDGTTMNASAMTAYNRLVEFKPGETTIIPGLAEDWVVEKGGLVYTFHLRKGVKFQTTDYFKPTRDFNADDVLFTFNRMRLKDHPFHKVNGGIYEYFESMELGTIIKDIVKVSDTTVKFILSRPEAPFLADLAMSFASITSAEYGDKLLKEKTPEKMDIFPVGTGPFIFKRYDKDSIIRFVANPTYFLGKAPIDNLVFAITPDPSVRFQKLKAGECHFVFAPAPADLPALKSDPKFKVLSQPGLNVGYLAMNVEKKPFDDLRVRQAFNHALNREAYIQAIYMGSAQVAKNPIPPTIWSYNKAVKDYPYDPSKAKALLKAAGFPNGFSTELWTLPVSRPYNPNGKKMGEMVQADLAKVGVQVKLLTYDWPTYLSKSRAGEHVTILFGWTGDNGDPDNFLSVLLGCSGVKGGTNYSRWCYKPFDDLVQKARVVSNEDERSKLYEKSQVIFKEQAPWVTLAHSVVYRAMRSNVVGYKTDPLDHDQFYGVDLK